MSITFYEMTAHDAEFIREVLRQYISEQQANAENNESRPVTRERFKAEVEKAYAVIYRMRFFTFDPDR